MSSCKLPECYTHADPLIKCCLVHPTPLWAKLIAVASRVYHAMKFVHREVIELCIDSQDFGLCLALLVNCLVISCRTSAYMVVPNNGW